MKINYSHTINTFQQSTSNVKKANVVFFTGNKACLSSEGVDIVELASNVSLDNLMKHVNFLCSDQTQGRRYDEEGIQIAKKYILNHFKELNLEPVTELGFNDYCHNFSGHYLSTVLDPVKPPKASNMLDNVASISSLFEPPPEGKASLELDMARKKELATATNILGKITGAKYPKDIILVTAHYDHLGTLNNKIYKGADDNASGVATMLEIARIIAQGEPPARTVVFAATSSEEFYRNGAQKLACKIIDEDLVDRIEVINMDMIAPTGGKYVDIWETSRPANARLVDKAKEASEQLDIDLRVFKDKEPATDAKLFSEYRVSSLNITGDYTDKGKKYHPHYHTPEDTPEKINKKFFYEAARLATATSYLAATEF